MAVLPVVLQLRHGPFWNFSYVIGTPGSYAIVIDPAWDVPAILGAASAHDMQVAHIALTHGHHDHAHGAGELVAHTGARVWAHRDELGLVAESFAAEVTPVEHDDELLVGRVPLRFLHTPGHTPGSLSLFLPGFVFTGDTLTTSARGRHGAHPGAKAELEHSLTSVLAGLPPETRLYPGHDAGREASCPLGTALTRALR